MKKYFICCLCVILLLFLMYLKIKYVNSNEIDTTELDTDYIIRQMQKNYSSLKTYSDTGYIESESVFILFYENEEDNAGEENKSLTKKTFETSFIRDAEMVLKLVDEDDEVLSWEIIAEFEKRLIFTRIYAVLLDNDGIIQEEDTSLHSLLSTQQRSSRDVSTIVPMLLLNDNVNRNINTKHDLERLDDAVLEGLDCFRIRRKHDVSHIDPGVETYYSVYWICKETFLIHLVEENIKHDGTMHSVTFHIPEIYTHHPNVVEFSLGSVASNTKIRYYPNLNIDLTTNITEPLSLQKQIKGEIYIPNCPQCARILNYIELVWEHDKIMFMGFACALLLILTLGYVMVRFIIRRFVLNCN